MIEVIEEIEVGAWLGWGRHLVLRIEKEQEGAWRQWRARERQRQGCAWCCV